jgi:hypothetical protein
VAQSSPFLHGRWAPMRRTFLQNFSALAVQTAARRALKVAAHAKMVLEASVCLDQNSRGNFSPKVGSRRSLVRQPSMQATSEVKFDLQCSPRLNVISAAGLGWGFARGFSVAALSSRHLESVPLLPRTAFRGLQM